VKPPWTETFEPFDKCVLELIDDRDLRLKGPKEQGGWRTGTFGQGVEVKLYTESFLSVSSQQILMGVFFFSFAPLILMQRLQIMDSENLVQVETLNRIKWQSFNFSTELNALGLKTQRGHSLDFFPKQLKFFLLLRNSL
jgi:hypothetical protein